MIYLGADHAGYDLKEQVKKYLDEKKIQFEDMGTYSKESVDASDYAVKVAKEVRKDKKNRGIIICGSGIMMSMAANKIKGARAGLCWSNKIAKQAREHNDINILALSGREDRPKDWKKIIDTFLFAKTLKKARYKKRIIKLNRIKP
ncbi:RpiB/LacA/LacB family sugar-phosphate isomerase [Patescibacteria group bacterium]|nr:RpiB/LacA/LacB family sugar-phosphate isomerase [Patescibacteria group bacterium]MBU1673072.1 RpiB/LacA/LacB family sugar-phosphate isomerase [Patescibacteria group bacterium]MBU1963678.1 RpiB/LacA/LacB family sugar-phosphate isomerase [Patescibacteria group bacterium]